MPCKRRPAYRAVGLTSLIDVIFLLLLFFMLASSFTNYQALPISGGAEGSNMTVRPIYLRIHDAEHIDLNGVQIARIDLHAKLAQLATEENRLVAIWSGPAAQVQDVVDMIALARTQGLQAMLVTGR